MINLEDIPSLSVVSLFYHIPFCYKIHNILMTPKAYSKKLVPKVVNDDKICRFQYYKVNMIFKLSHASRMQM